MVEDHRLALAARDRHRHELFGKAAFGPGARGVLVAAHGIGIGRLAGDAVILGEVLGGLDHPGDDAEACDRLAHQPPAGEPVVQRHLAHPHPAAQIGGVVLDIRHALDPAGDHHVGGAGGHHHRRGGDRLHARAAAPIELEARHLERQAGRQPAPVPDRGGLAIAIALAEDDIIDPRRIDPRSFDQGLEDHRAKLARGQARQPAHEFAHRRAQRGADGNAPHHFASLSERATIPASTSLPISPEDSPSLSASTSSECSPR
ncbi:MAG: hypothetical protein KatS3mg120_2835 [Erythrobacter sp.]|nr:MAG: hypothetical protein KatS3mg120_2835 [Erythrobacter sp.]